MEGQIPGKDYTLSTWTTKHLRSWFQQNLGNLLPQSIKTQDAQLETLSVDTTLTLSPAALADLKTQLGL